MNRREFCGGALSLLGLPAASLAQPTQTRPAKTSSPRFPDGPAGAGRGLYLFNDYRHIDPGDLSWVAPDGQRLPVAGPPVPVVEAHADAAGVAQGIKLVAQRATTTGPHDGIPGNITFDNGVYRSWSFRVDYGQGQDLGSYSLAPATAMVVSYGESKDGFEWKWRETCAVKPPPVTGIDGAYFFPDPRAPEQERFKCIFNARVLSGVADLWQKYQQVHPRYRDVRIGPDRVYCLFGMVSPDGLNWKPIAEPLLIHMGDTDNTVYYDEWLGKYVLYTRLYWMSRRMIARAESEDFRHWTPVSPVVWPQVDDPLSWDVYTNGRTCYPGLPEQHFLFPALYRRLTQTSETHLYSSTDGIRWDRVPGGAVLQSGTPGNWDEGWLVPGKNLIPLSGDRLAIPYTAMDHPHKYPRWPGVIKGRSAYATWPKERMVALTAVETGNFRTFPMNPTGKRLRINARVSRAGEIRIGLSGIPGHGCAECDPIVGDQSSQILTWKGKEETSVSRDKGVTLTVQMRAAELFALEWV